YFFFSSRRRHTRFSRDWSSDVCSSDLSQGRIEFQYFPAEQLGKAKDLLTLVQSGAADIVDISPSYISDKFALSSVAELPAMFNRSEERRGGTECRAGWCPER